MEAKHVNEFRPNDVMWEETSKDLLRNPDRLLKNTDKRMVYIYNIFFAKKDFTFGLRTVKPGEIHLIQTTHVPMLIYELPASSLKCRANVIRRSFEPHDQKLYHQTILEPHSAYPIPAGTHYIVLTVEKTAFGLDIIPESLLPQLIQKGFHVGDFRKMKKFNQTPYKLPPPTPIHVPAEKRPLEEKSLPKKRVRITLVMRRVSRRSELPIAPVQIPVSQVPQSPVQSLPEPMQLLPMLDILDPLESTDAFDQLMSFVFGPQELQLLHTVPSIFDGDLFSFLDEFEREPMDLTMPRLNSCVQKSMDPSNPWICLSILLSVNNLSEPSNPCLSIVACSSLYIFFVCPDLCQKFYRSHPTHGSVNSCL
ncbi:uncharacterized protein TNCV_4495361 [Trichonephila clavipes]|nr:uncharacterized protein TNCV_4495361 [Trichonephila clavipes]